MNVALLLRVWRLLRRTVRLTRMDYRRAGIPPVVVLYAHSDGSPVRKAETEGRPLRKLAVLCGVQVSTRWGSVMLQWRGFPKA